MGVTEKNISCITLSKHIILSCAQQTQFTTQDIDQFVEKGEKGLEHAVKTIMARTINKHHQFVMYTQ